MLRYGWCYGVELCRMLHGLVMVRFTALSHDVCCVVRLLLVLQC